MIFVIVRRRSTGRLTFLIAGRRSRIVVDVDCSLRSNNFYRRIEKAMNVSTGVLRSTESSSETNAERNLNVDKRKRFLQNQNKKKRDQFTIENDVIPSTA